VEVSWRTDGRTFSIWTQPVPLEQTQALRDHALRIVEWVLNNGPWLATLGALSVLQEATRSVAPIDTSHVEDADAFRAEWKPERLKALAIYETALTKQPHVAVRYEIRHALRLALAFEKDTEFAKACRNVIKKSLTDKC